MHRLYKTDRTIYLSSLFLYNFARVLPHAILTVILLNKGMSVSQIAIIQSFYMLAAIMFEFPSGFLTDVWSEKIMYQLSLILIGISYSIILFTNNYYILCLSWFIYGMSAASMSGSLDAYFVRRAKDNHEIKRINVLINHSTLYSGLIGGGLGSFLYELLSEHIYVLSLLLIFLSLILISFGFHADKVGENKDTTTSESFQKIIEELTNIKHQKKLIVVIGLFAIFQIISQLFYQFWQVSFLEKDFSKTYFGLLYILFQIIAILSNNIFSKYDFSKLLIPLTISLSSALLLSIFAPNKILFLVFVIIFLIPFNLYNNQIIVNIQKESDPNIVASVVSLAGTISSIISMIVLWIIGILNNYFDFWCVEIVLITIFIILTLTLLIKYPSHKKLN